MTSFAANLNALQDGIDSIRASHASLESQQDELRRLIAPLTATFVGEWGQNFEGLKQKWDADASNVYEILRNLLTALETAHINYTNVGAAVARSMAPGG